MIRQRLLFSTWIIAIYDIIVIIFSYLLTFLVKGVLPPRYEIQFGWYKVYYLRTFVLYLAFTLFFLYFYQRAYPMFFPIDFIELYKRTFKAVWEAVVTLVILFYFIRIFHHSRLFLLLYGVITSIFLVLERRILFKKFRFKNPCHVMIVGEGRKADELKRAIEEHKFLGFQVEKILPLSQIHRIEKIICDSPIDWIIFTGNKKDRRRIESAILKCEEIGITTSYLLETDISPRIAKLSTDMLFGHPLITFHTISEKHFELFLKYTLDKILAFIFILFTSPIMIVAAIMIKLTSKGPVIFKQTRLGLNGRKFTLYKFRTMYLGAEKEMEDLKHMSDMDGAAFKLKKDPRVTRIGKILRKFSIDELPQFFNVLKGDMSIVGPRPPLLIEVEEYKPWQRRRLSMKPGLTCIWQISGRNDVSFQEWMEMDLSYIDNWSLWLDLIIMLKTLPAILFGKGAY